MKIGLIGNPNSGKTTLFNQLTGSSARVGNWPGITVEKKSGYIKGKRGEEKIEVVDLPGLYSLSPYSPEEVVSRNFILEEKPDLIVDIIDSTNLERNLYLTTQLIELDVPVLVALNMSDELQKRGESIDTNRLSSVLGLPVVSISALHNRGIKELRQAIKVVGKTKRTGSTIYSSYLKPKLAELLHSTWHLLHEEMGENTSFHAVKFFEGDSIDLQSSLTLAKEFEKLKNKCFANDKADDLEAAIADARYRYIEKECSVVLSKSSSTSVSTTEKIDKVVTGKVFGIPIFLLVMFGVFHLVFSENLLYLSWLIPDSFENDFFGSGALNSPGVVLFNLMEFLTGKIMDFFTGIMPEGTWYTGLLLDGILTGVFSVLSFVPQIMCLYFFIGILEDTGYMARVAFIMDRAFRRLGLSGKVFMPFICCFGCAVPGISACRTLEDEKVRRRAIFLTPFFSCGAKLPIWAAFAGVFATAKGISGEFIVSSIYLLGILVAIVGALILKVGIIKGDAPPFVMELPSYRRPLFKNLLVLLWEKLSHYIYKCATIITGSIVVIWFLSTFNFTFKMVEDSGDSIIGVISKGLSYLFVPLGFGYGEDGWKFVVAAITGLIAKEMVVATMGTFSGLDGDEVPEDVEAGSPLALMMLGIGGSMFGLDVAIPAMFSFLAFNLLSVPCMAAVAAARAELGKKGRIWGAVAWWMSVAYVVSFVIFWIGVLISWLVSLGA